ncbi:MAG: DUF3078 domain-containing protein, partial [Paramuribaculum sp.]|nr:DUF3078 domain-containing protein [Paramuribaculum sp.]
MKRLILHMTLWALSAISGAVATATPLRSALCREAIQRPETAMTRPAATDPDTLIILPWFDDELATDIHLLDTANVDPDTVITEYIRDIFPIPAGDYSRPVFDGYQFLDTLTLSVPYHSEIAGDAYYWLDDLKTGRLLAARARQLYMSENPTAVKYNVWMLPERPKEYAAIINPHTRRIEMQERIVGDRRSEVTSIAPEIDRKIWIQSLAINAQFSQAYVSPNWYQGGNRSLIMLINAGYNVKLNQRYYPKLLFEASAGYKLGTNTTPDDTIRSMNISEDLLQINSTFGYKAARRWYYSLNLQFKTQLFNSYPSNSDKLKSAFLSPGELNLGLGMTYNYQNDKKTFDFNATIAPLSWQLSTCISRRINEESYGIRSGRNARCEYGSIAEDKLNG